MPPDPEEMGLDEASMTRLAGIMASSESSDFERFEPPADLWSRIESGVNAPIAVLPVVLTHDEDQPMAEPIPIGARRTPRWRILSAAAAVAIIAAVGGVLVVNRSSESLISTTKLVALDGGSTSVDAELIKVNGETKLRLTAHNMGQAPDGKFYELWLMDRANTIPNSLGAMTGSTTVIVPASLDVDRYPVVDISLQPTGQPDYSGQSILRGTLS